ncbi:hypothetical protein CUMW_216450 [Citrus unshiu]|uniref:Uncharacterized protein n=1 Tax=Citrus unshiu TaxID=55188 RepID=A0A2H5QC98_CITUN|nr:hypothetical protein CUMW_216450 [Citrus unshiu]
MHLGRKWVLARKHGDHPPRPNGHRLMTMKDAQTVTVRFFSEDIVSQRRRRPSVPFQLRHEFSGKQTLKIRRPGCPMNRPAHQLSMAQAHLGF